MDTIETPKPFLTNLKYRIMIIWKIYRKDYKKVLGYSAKEDSPRPMNFQLELMKKLGFTKTEILHKNMFFGAFGGIK